MTDVTKQDIDSWYIHPVTQKFLELLKDEKLDMGETCVSTAVSMDHILMYRGKTELINKIVNKEVFDEYFSIDTE